MSTQDQVYKLSMKKVRSGTMKKANTIVRMDRLWNMLMAINSGFWMVSYTERMDQQSNILMVTSVGIWMMWSTRKPNSIRSWMKRTVLDLQVCHYRWCGI